MTTLGFVCPAYAIPDSRQPLSKANNFLSISYNSLYHETHIILILNKHRLLVHLHVDRLPLLIRNIRHIRLYLHLFKRQAAFIVARTQKQILPLLLRPIPFLCLSSFHPSDI